MEFKHTNHNRDRRGFTVVEMVIGVAIGSLLLAALATLYVFSMRSFAAMANYSDLNQKSRYASDIISRDIRSAHNVISATPALNAATQLVLNEPDDVTGTTGTTVTYIYDEVLGTLSKIKNGQTNVLLSGVDSMSFKLCQRPFVASKYEDFPVASSASAAKLVSFQWSCSRRLVGSLNNSESLEAAMVELRNQ
jgi:prepilin-type N-terminal cleavage/methylation domain-containing protein